MAKIIKVLSINILVLFLGILLMELIFGGWLRDSKKLDNLNISRDIDITFETELYSPVPIKIHYSRDKFGFRGKSTYNNPKKINILTVGGSTTVQAYISDGETWQDVLENCFKQNGQEILVSNSGIDGQSTIGHIKNFQVWYPQVPKLNPNYIIFYIGINDFYRIDNYKYDDLLGTSSFMNRIRTNSLFYNFLRILKGVIAAEKVEVGHRKVNISELVYTDIGIADEEIFNFHQEYLDRFEERIKVLIEYSSKLGAEPIFVTQPSMMYKFNDSGQLIGLANTKKVGEFKYNGIDYFNMICELNNRIKKVCSDKYLVIDLTTRKIWTPEDFYDLFHNTPNGAKKIGNEIYKEVKHMIGNN